MSLTIPKTTDYALKRGDRSLAVWALQRACNRLGVPTGEDGDFGPGTEASVKKVQAKLRILADGIAGPGTQTAIGKYIAYDKEGDKKLPQHLLSSVFNHESSYYLGAVNWSSPGGVDCGLAQRRVYERDYGNDAVIYRAFDGFYQAGLVANQISELKSIYYSRPPVDTYEFAYRLAVLHHNYPSASDLISKVGISGLSAYWRTPQTWVVNAGMKFPDNTSIRTPLEWCQHYSLGNSAHNDPGQAVKLVHW